MSHIEAPSPAQQAIEEAECIVHEAQLGHAGPPPPEPPDDFDNYRRRPEKHPWGWLNTLGVMLAVGGFAAFFKSTHGLEAAASYTSMVAGVVLIEMRNREK